MPSIDLSTLRRGSRVKLRGPTKAEGIPAKPYPLGWKAVEYVYQDRTAIQVEGDHRWLPVYLVTEVRNVV